MAAVVKHLTLEELEGGLDDIRRSPKNGGMLKLIVRRPAAQQREVLTEGELNQVEGLAGDTWKDRSSTRTADGSPHRDMQLNIMNARAIALLAQTEDRWHLAGDQLYLDLDLSAENVPPGTRLSLGSAVIEVTSQPHTGCDKFALRFGQAATKFVNSPIGKQLQLRGINAKVVTPGRIRVGDLARKMSRTFP